MFMSLMGVWGEGRQTLPVPVLSMANGKRHHQQIIVPRQIPSLKSKSSGTCDSQFHSFNCIICVDDVTTEEQIFRSSPLTQSIKIIRQKWRGC
jgi:hypothetical protein